MFGMAPEAALDNDKCHCVRCPLFLLISLRIRIELFRRYCFCSFFISQFPLGGLRGVRWRIGREYCRNPTGSGTGLDCSGSAFCFFNSRISLLVS